MTVSCRMLLDVRVRDLLCKIFVRSLYEYFVLYRPRDFFDGQLCHQQHYARCALTPSEHRHDTILKNQNSKTKRRKKFKMRSIFVVRSYEIWLRLQYSELLTIIVNILLPGPRRAKRLIKK